MALERDKAEYFRDAKRGWRREKESLQDQILPCIEAMNLAFTVERGSFVGRTLEQYHEILCHNGAVDFFYRAKKIQEDLAIADLGCGACVALADLRKLFPFAKLIGIDVRNIRLNWLREADGSKKTVGRILQTKKIDFYQDLIMHVEKRIPEKADIILCVGAFYDTSRDYYALRIPLLRRCYKSLKKGGIAQIHLTGSQWHFFRIVQTLHRLSIPFQFNEADERILWKHGLGGNGGIPGTLTLGPRPD